jgi:hypothetical protein
MRSLILVAMAVVACKGKPRDPDPCFAGSERNYSAYTGGPVEEVGCVLSAPVREHGIVCRAGRDAKDSADLRRAKNGGHLTRCVLAEPAELKKVRAPAGARVYFWSNGNVKRIDSLDAPLQVAGHKAPCLIVRFDDPHVSCHEPIKQDAGVEAEPASPPVWYLDAPAPAGTVQFAVPVVLNGRATGPEYRLVQQKGRIAGCFTHEQVGEGLGNELVVRVVIDTSGVAVLASPQSSTFPPDATVGECVKGVLIGAPLENPTEAGSTIDYRFRLKRG